MTNAIEVVIRQGLSEMKVTLGECSVLCISRNFTDDGVSVIVEEHDDTDILELLESTGDRITLEDVTPSEDGVQTRREQRFEDDMNADEPSPYDDTDDTEEHGQEPSHSDLSVVQLSAHDMTSIDTVIKETFEVNASDEAEDTIDETLVSGEDDPEDEDVVKAVQDPSALEGVEGLEDAEQDTPAETAYTSDEEDDEMNPDTIEAESTQYYGPYTD